MPTSGLDYDKHGRPARVKLRKDQDNRSIISSSSGRRHRDSSVSSSRTALPPEYPTQRPASTCSNANVDQLHSLSESESGSPASVSSPMLRTISNISTSISTTSPTVPRMPAFLQPYLESESDFSDMGDSQVTPKAEKSKEQCEVKHEAPKVTRPKIVPPKVLPTPSDTVASTQTKQVSSESTKAVSVRSSPRAEPPPPPLTQETQYQDIHQPAPKHPIPSNLAFVPDQSNPAPTYAYGNIPPIQQAFQSPQLTYLPLPQQADPITAQQALAPQGLLYYPDYGPPPPVPELPHHVQYPPGPVDRPRDENPMALLSRVQYAMPDLHTLLESYHNMYVALESRENQLRTTEAQRAAEKQQQESRFAKLEKEIESLLKKHSTESSRLRLDISNVDKKCKDLQERLTTQEKTNNVLEASNENLRAEKSLTLKKHEEEKAAITQKYSVDKDRMAAEHRAKQRASYDELQAQTRKAEATLSHSEAHLSRAHEEEKHKLETACARQRREIEDRHATLQMEMEDKLEAKQKVVDEERRTYLHAREGWDRERELMNRRWDEEREIARKASEEQYKALTTRCEREKNETMKQISQMQQRSDKDESILRLQREIGTMRSDWEADKFKFQRTTAEFRSTARTLNDQNNKLQSLTETFGDAVEVKGK